MAKIRPRQEIDYNTQYLDAVFGDFIEEKRALGRANETLVSYTVTYEKFKQYFGKRAELTGDIVGSMFVEWINAMRDSGLRDASINHHLQSMRAFLYWCMDDSRKYIRPFKIVRVKVQEELPKDYSLEEVKLLLERPSKDATFVEWRNWAVCSFILGTAARLGTIVEIKMEDIDLKEGKVFYRHTKNKKLQIANMPPQLVQSLNTYINICRYDAGPEDYLFCSVTGDPPSKASIKHSFSVYARKRGVDKTSLHGLRHTFAREWYLNGGDVVQLSKILGHSSLDMSEKYMNIYADAARDRFIQFNPLENINRGKNTGAHIQPKKKRG